MTEPWEDQLRQGLDAMSDLGAEAPPDIAELQMLVAHVQREQRRSLWRDLALFWTCAVLLLTGGFYAVSRNPVYFVAFQVVAAAAMVVGGAFYAVGRKRVTE